MNSADMGRVTPQLIRIFLIVSVLILSRPSTKATPVIAPIRQCVVDTLRPSCVAVSTVKAVPI